MKLWPKSPRVLLVVAVGLLLLTSSLVALSYSDQVVKGCRNNPTYEECMRLRPEGSKDFVSPSPTNIAFFTSQTITTTGYGSSVFMDFEGVQRVATLGSLFGAVLWSMFLAVLVSLLVPERTTLAIPPQRPQPPA